MMTVFRLRSFLADSSADMSCRIFFICCWYKVRVQAFITSCKSFFCFRRSPSSSRMSEGLLRWANGDLMHLRVQLVESLKEGRTYLMNPICAVGLVTRSLSMKGATGRPSSPCPTGWVLLHQALHPALRYPKWSALVGDITGLDEGSSWGCWDGPHRWVKVVQLLFKASRISMSSHICEPGSILSYPPGPPRLLLGEVGEKMLHSGELRILNEKMYGAVVVL